MKNTKFLKALMLVIICCFSVHVKGSGCYCCRENDLIMTGVVYNGANVIANQPVYIMSLPVPASPVFTIPPASASPVYSTTAHTNGSGNFTAHIYFPGNDTYCNSPYGPDYQWLIITYNSCRNDYDTLHYSGLGGPYVYSYTDFDGRSIFTFTQNFVFHTCDSSCHADFTSSGNARAILFSNLSSGTHLDYELDFGDGTVFTPEPSYLFDNYSPVTHFYLPGTYQACLNIQNNQGCSDDTCKTFTVPPNADCAEASNNEFWMVETPGSCISWLRFYQKYNLAGNTLTLIWDYGDGDKDTVNYPADTGGFIPPKEVFQSHVYTQPVNSCNVHLTRLIYSNSTLVCSKTFSLPVNPCTTIPPNNFSASFNPVKASPFVYSFQNTSQGGYLSTNWTFGDGSTSTLYSPLHPYPSGTYDVCLYLSNRYVGCRDTACQTISFMDTCALIANAGPDKFICQNGTTLIGGNPTASGGVVSLYGYNYRWSPATGLNGSQRSNPTAILTGSGPNTVTYSVTVTDVVGCTATDAVNVSFNDYLTVKSLTLMREGMLGSLGTFYEYRPPINRDTLCRFSIRADLCQSPVGSVKFILNGNTVKIEGRAPYVLAGDDQSGIIPWTPTPGNYTLTVIAYSGAVATGQAGPPYTINFTVLAGHNAPCVGPPFNCPGGCNDTDGCTIDACVNGNCLHEPKNCEDNWVCTVDQCTNGYCDHLIDCHDNDNCTMDYCQGSNCVHPPKNCSDNNGCTIDNCINGSCTHAANCNDGNPCTIDICVGGILCDNTPRTCDDNNSCTTDTCAQGVCIFTPISQPSYLKVTNPSSSWRKLKLGYSSTSLWTPKQDVIAGGNNMLCVTMRDVLGTAQWNKIRIRPQGIGGILLSSYVPANAGTDRFTICIPVIAFTAVNFTQLSMIEIPYSTGAAAFEIHIQKIEFTGGTTPFLWFGDPHTNNYHDGQSGGSSTLVATLVPGCGASKMQEAGENQPLILENQGVLLAAFPNPFKDAVTISFSVTESGRARLELVNMDGRLIETLFEGTVIGNEIQNIELQAGNIPSGMYFCRMITESGIIENRKLLLMN